MGRRTKVSHFIAEGDLFGLKAYLRKHKRHFNIKRTRLDSRGRTALHVACKHKQLDITVYLLRHRIDPLLKDFNGNVPLISALKNSLRNKESFRIAIALIKACPEAMTIPNKEGLTASQLLEELERQNNFQDNDTSPELAAQPDENSWDQKLRDEMDDEYCREWGAYEEDYFMETPETESYSDWTNRISSEFNTKKRQQYQAHYVKTPTSENQSSSWTKDDQERFERKCRLEEMEREARKAQQKLKKFCRKKSNYELMCSRLFSPNTDLDTISFEDLPSDVDKLIAILISDISKDDSAAIKCYLREQRIKWHPDKFVQKCGHRLHPPDKERILERVKELSQVINAHLESL